MLRKLVSLVILATVVSSLPAQAPHKELPSRTNSARQSSPTVPYASDSPNGVIFGTTTGQRGKLGANVIGPNNLPIVYENPDLLAPPTTDEGSV